MIPDPDSDRNPGARRSPTAPSTETLVNLDDKIAYLSDPASYPEKPSELKAIETHRSWVFLTEDHAYKFKKPVHLPFLDFSTLDKRLENCRAELRLNRRLAPEIYLGVVALLFAWSAKVALLEPFAITCMMQAHFNAIAGQTPEPEWEAKLDGLSSKFRTLKEEATQGGSEAEAPGPTQ